ncbi:sensorin-A precursor [Aplysia californica]|uniref:Sensorin-A n=1 Tax=Aplysia californica TaxID=6500 RepID=SENA_APLCA|nr:sensorin-A precursor [Aplysia californica]P29233.1 RecName: Full=Sensorin-A; Contains: RecName: Full=Peptide B; Contains: RecName: Full=Sensorin-A; Flags: Precursor [Aplysia californica]CAA40089.1 sensorin A [Aplysia californica]
MPSRAATSPLNVQMMVVLCIVCLALQAVAANATRSKNNVPRRFPRARYRVGYMFGKRSSSETYSTNLINLLSRQLVSQEELRAILEKQPILLDEVVKILDRNDDGYITVADLL